MANFEKKKKKNRNQGYFFVTCGESSQTCLKNLKILRVVELGEDAFYQRFLQQILNYLPPLVKSVNVISYFLFQCTFLLT